VSPDCDRQDADSQFSRSILIRQRSCRLVRAWLVHSLRASGKAGFSAWVVRVRFDP
jgi:hypothetical protein